MRPPPPKREPELFVQGVGLSRRPSTTVIRRSGSIGNLPKATIVPATRPAAVTSCHCPSAPVLRDNKSELYAKSLEQQVQLLELENEFLKHDQSTRAPLAGERQEYSQILARGNEVSLNGKDWCALPSFHPPLEKVLEQRMGRMQQNLHKETSFDTSIVTRGQSAKHFSSGRGSPGRRSSSPRGRGHSSHHPSSPDAAILQELEVKNQEVETLRDQLEAESRRSSQRDQRMEQLTTRLREAESDLSSRSEADTRDKRALMEELLELQRRLDDLTPTLAEKEARIVRMEEEREAVVAKLRASKNETADLKLKLSEQQREGEMYSERESTVKEESIRLRGQLDTQRTEMEERRRREDQLMDEISALKREVKETHMKHNNDRVVMNQMSSENSKLISENSRLTSESARMEFEMARREQDKRGGAKTYTEEEIVELRLSMKAHQTRAGILEERLAAAGERYTVLEREMEERATAEDGSRNERQRIQQELEALQALSRSLSNENKSLREEKMSLLEKVEAMRNKLSARDIQMKNLENEMADREEKHQMELEGARQQNRQHGQRAVELEELSRRVRELSDSLPSSDVRSPSQRARSTRMLERGCDIERMIETGSSEVATRTKP